MLSKRELDQIERETWRRVCAIGETGGCSLTEAADFSTRQLFRVLRSHKELVRDEHEEMATG